MIDCLDKQQQQQQTQQQEQQPFWLQQQPIQSAMRPLPCSTALSDSTNQAMMQQHRQQPLVELNSPQQADEIPQLQQQSGNNDLIGYYFGSISRETAEWILKNHGNYVDGAYLLRSSGPKDDFVLSLLVVHETNGKTLAQHHVVGNSTNNNSLATRQANLEVLHYKIVETEDSFVALHGQVGDEKFATIDELIEKAQGVATKPRWPIQRYSLETQILPPTFWGLTIDQVRLAILIKAKQWGFPMSIFQQPVASSTAYQVEQQQQVIDGQMDSIANDNLNNNSSNTTTLNNETIRTLIYKSLHEFQPWFHGRISRDEAERRIEDGQQRDGRFLVRERDNYSYAICICHKRTTKHYRVDVLSTGELAIQDGRKFTSLMALVSHYTIMSDGLWCALTESCPRPILQQNRLGQSSDGSQISQFATLSHDNNSNNNIYCVPPSMNNRNRQVANVPTSDNTNSSTHSNSTTRRYQHRQTAQNKQSGALICPNQSATAAALSIKAPIKEWLHTINHKWSQMIASKTNQQHQSLNSFLFGSSNPLNNHCRHHRSHQHNNHQNRDQQRRRCKKHQANHQHDNEARRGQSIKNDPQSNQLKTLPASRGGCDCCLSENRNAQLATHNRVTRGLYNPNNLNQYLNSDVGNRTLLVGHAGSAAIPVPPTTDCSKALLSCLPQNSGFMLDSQSFIGSPLFAIKANPLSNINNVIMNDSLNGYHGLPNNMTANINGGNTANAKANGDNVAKLISPAQSISANLNNLPLASNPYALNNNDIYGSQTSTAIVNDHLLTSSSSSSGNQNNLRIHSRQPARQTVDLKQQMRANRHSLANNLNSAYQANLGGVYRARPGAPLLESQMSRDSFISAQASQAQRLPQKLMPVQHAGLIVCGQHAGPAYRYTNCTNETSYPRQCIHTTSLGIGSNRTADDMLLLGPSTQLAGPAALSKFVQFQDGQCLRTHRDTKSIQMAYLLSRQEALNMMNNRVGSSATMQSQQHRQTSFQHQQQIPNDFRNAPNVARSSQFARNNQAPCGSQVTVHLNQNQNLQQQQQQQQQQADYDLMDLDGKGFQFKYDPKLIKSSSIETLCGAGDGDDQNRADDQIDFKTNSELLMSLQSCWTSSNHDMAPANDILIPLVPANNDPHEDLNIMANCQQPNLQADLDCLRTLIGEETHYNIGATGQCDEIWRKKHNLDEMTTSLLAELTASLKAQVDLKNKRSGLCSATETSQDQHSVNQCSNATSTQIADNSRKPGDSSNSTETNPIELINEFDTLK